MQILKLNSKVFMNWAAIFLCSLNLMHYGFAQTQTLNFPVKPVRIIVPQTPGGASDALARIVGQKLSEKWGQPVVIEIVPALVAILEWTQ